ncbi:hypothetical protein PG996_003694 [Apiospora saccharicola]|uniref:Uncharacterized protein n=1 Tax=Apiospora saccharicola TaxID=335842 RepID=A0ABR1W5T3_9PEZI
MAPPFARVRCAGKASATLLDEHATDTKLHKPEPKIAKTKASGSRRHWYERKDAPKVWQRRRLSIESTASDAVPLRLTEK